MNTENILELIRSRRKHYINLFNTNPTTDAGTSILEFYRGAMYALLELENDIIFTNNK
jgi:hypothetical protein